MNGRRISGHVETATNIAVIAAVILIATVLLTGYLMPKAKVRPLAGLQRGKTISQFKTAGQQGASYRRLVIALDTKCGYCVDSIPFYHRLADLQRNSGGQLHVLALFHEGESPGQYLQSNQLGVEAVDGVDFEALGVGTTPTMILVDGAGTVKDFWVGKLSEEGQEQVMKTLLSPQG